MRPFEYLRAADVSSALDAIATHENAKFLAGGTNLVDLVRQNIERPTTMVDVSRLPLSDIEELPNGSLRIGATVRNSHLAAHPLVRARYPMLSQALLAGASGQLRNMATVGGNLLQRTRCLYFYDTIAQCNKREPGRGCDAIEGFHRSSAILGTSTSCIATHPSDMCVALVALDATVEVQSRRGTRRIALADFHRLPQATPHLESQLESDELIIAVEIPPLSFAAHSRYRKVRDRASYAFALVSVATAVQVDQGIVRDVRLALGGVGTIPWRARKAEGILRGGRVTTASFEAAADAELAPAVARPGNAFKVDLARRTITATLRHLCNPSAT